MVRFTVILAAILTSCSPLEERATAPALDPDPVLRTATFALDGGADADMTPNTPPVALDDLVTVDEDGDVTFNVLDNDVDDDGDLLTVFVSDSANDGLLEALGAGEFRYTPRSNFVGDDAFTYGVLDGNGGSAEANVSITVVGTNDPPQFVPPTPPEGARLDAVVGRAFDLPVVARDIDGDELTLGFAGVTAAVMPVLENEALRWTPTGEDVGSYALSLSADDGSVEVVRQMTLTVTPATEAPCGDSFCEAGTTCFDGVCLPPCLVDEDCPADDRCFEGHCAVDACEHRSCESPFTCEAGGCFRSCSFDGECRPGQRCWGTRCAESSCQDVVCATDSVCVGGTCRPACESDNDCASGACFGGGCATDACDGVLCPAGQVCADGACAASPDAEPEEPRFEGDGCGCAQAGALPGGLLVFVLLFGLLRRR